MELFVWKNVNCFPDFMCDQDFSIKLFLRKKIIHDYFSFPLKRLCGLGCKGEEGEEEKKKSLHAFSYSDNYKPFVCAQTRG